jgi:hypothetical protein
MLTTETIMDKNLTVYPITTGNELSVFSTESIQEIRIMDMQGGLVYTQPLTGVKKSIIDIKNLPDSTYIVEAVFENNKTGRSIFVKM